jgi:hypothetical protein
MVCGFVGVVGGVIVVDVDSGCCWLECDVCHRAITHGGAFLFASSLLNI